MLVKTKSENQCSRNICFITVKQSNRRESLLQFDVTGKPKFTPDAQLIHEQLPRYLAASPQAGICDGGDYGYGAEVELQPRLRVWVITERDSVFGSF